MISNLFKKRFRNCELVGCTLSGGSIDGGVQVGLAADIDRFGFVDRAETLLSFDQTTYELTLAPAAAGGEWSYYRSGVKTTVTSSKTATLPIVDPATVPDAGTYYAYIDDAAGGLEFGPVWTFSGTKVPVGIVLWNDAATPKFLLVDERHTCLIDRMMHQYLHETRGTQLISLGVVGGYTVPGAAPANDGANTFSITGASVIADEDIYHTLPGFADPDGAVNAYLVFYRTEASAYAWRMSEVPFLYTESGYIQYDATGLMTQGAASKWYNTYLVAAPFGFMMIHGRSVFSSLAAAQAEDPSLFDFTGFPIAESVIVKQYTWTTSNSYSTKGKCKLAAQPKTVSVTVTSAVVPVSGVGTLGTQNYDDVSITGGEITGTNFAPKRITKTATGTLTLEECMGTVIDNTGQAAAMTLTIPAAVSDIGFKFEVVTPGFPIYLKAGTGDKHYLDGVALDDGDKIGIAAPALGDCVYVEGMRTGDSTYDLRSSSGVGAWADSGQ